MSPEPILDPVEVTDHAQAVLKRCLRPRAGRQARGECPACGQFVPAASTRFHALTCAALRADVILQRVATNS